MIRFALTALLLATACAGAYEPPVPAQEVAVARYGWHDSKRNRDVPAKLYFPKDGAGPWPVIVFSHGLGGSRENYEYLGRHWAGCGYVSVHLQHPGSDDAVWKEAGSQAPKAALTAAAADLRNAMHRPRDVSFAIDQLHVLNAAADSPLRARLDLKHIGVAGHSFGAFTTLAIAGQNSSARVPLGLADPRVTCAIPMSAPVPRPAVRAHAYDAITMPVFHMTGTKDDSPIGDTKAAERRIPFDRMTRAETCLVTFTDGDHMIFSGRARPGEPDNAADAKFHRLICLGSTAFWDAWLKGDTAARAWLMEGGFARALGQAGVFEQKVPGQGR